MAEDSFLASGTVFEETVDLAVIGAGLAGLAASVFAVNRGISVARLGSTGDIAYTTGYLDILGLPVGGCEPCANPRDGIAELLRHNPEHPYGKTYMAGIAAALSEFTAFLWEA